jgi:hypothetical protein
MIIFYFLLLFVVDAIEVNSWTFWAVVCRSGFWVKIYHNKALGISQPEHQLFLLPDSW